MLKFFKTKYRIVETYYGSYRAQYKVWYSPFYVDLSYRDHSKMDAAEVEIQYEIKKSIGNQVVKYVEAN